MDLIKKVKLPLKNKSGNVIKDIAVSDGLFALPLTKRLRGVIHQAIVRQRANARLGTASVKNRSQVTGSTRKLFPQKGTGRARGGSVKSPIRRGGGIAFGPHPRSYSQRIPKKMRRLAIRGALSSKVAHNRIALVDNLGINHPKTKEMSQVLASLGAKSSALVVTLDPNATVIKSSSNLPKVKTLPARYLNVLDLLAHDLLVIELEALRKAEDMWAPGGRTIEAEVKQKTAVAKPKQQRAKSKPNVAAKKTTKLATEGKQSKKKTKSSKAVQE